MLDGGRGGGAFYFVANTGLQHLRQCASPFPCFFFCSFVYNTVSLNQPLKSNRNLLNWIEISLATIYLYVCMYVS